MNFIQITPFIYVANLAKALAFFENLLGFKVLARYPNYAYVQRETAAIRLLECADPAEITPGNRRFAYYVDVRDVDALYAELKPKLDQLPRGDVYPPANKPYGQREFLVLAPDGNIIAFGQAIDPANSVEHIRPPTANGGNVDRRS